MIQQVFKQKVLSHVLPSNNLGEVCNEWTQTWWQDLPLWIFPQLPFAAEGMLGFHQMKVIIMIVVHTQILDGRITSTVAGHIHIDTTNKPWAWHLGVSFAFGGFIVGYPLLNAMGFFLPPSVAQTAPICCNAKGLHSWVTLCWILWVSSCHLLWHGLLLFAAMQRGFIVGYLCWILWISSCHLLWYWLLPPAAMQRGFIVGYPLLNSVDFIMLSAAVVLWCQNLSSSNKANPNRCFKFISTVFQIPIFSVFKNILRLLKCF